MILDKDSFELLVLSKIIGIVSIIFISLIIVFLVRFVLNVLFRSEFEFIHNEIKKGNIAVAVYSGLIIGAISLGVIYAITMFLL